MSENVLSYKDKYMYTLQGSQRPEREDLTARGGNLNKSASLKQWRRAADGYSRGLQRYQNLNRHGIYLRQ